jgi:addiction module HigA family antidote
MSLRELARQMGRPFQTVNEIVNGKKAITAETALDLERVFGGDAETWMNLQLTYDLTIARRRRASAGPIANSNGSLVTQVLPSVSAISAWQKRDTEHRRPSFVEVAVDPCANTQKGVETRP